MNFQYRKLDGTIMSKEEIDKKEYDESGTPAVFMLLGSSGIFYRFADGSVLSAEELQKKINGNK